MKLREKRDNMYGSILALKILTGTKMRVIFGEYR